jgi:hypothetical protein
VVSGSARASLVTAGVVEVVGCVDEGGGWWGVSGGPGVPGVEGVEVLFGGGEPVGVAVEAAGELLVDLEVLLQPGAVPDGAGRVGRGVVGRGG